MNSPKGIPNIESRSYILKAQPFVSLIILSFNSRKFEDLFDNCVRSVLETDYPAFEVLIVANGSTDNGEQIIFDKYCKSYSNLRLVKLPHNMGYAGGNNQGAKHASDLAEYIAFLNSDILVARDWLLPLVDGLLSDRRAGVVGPSGTFVTLGVMPCPLKSKAHLPYYTNHILGHCLVVRRRLFELVHGFNVSYFMYLDEVDICERIRATGYQSLVIPTSRVEHAPSSSFAANRMLVDRSFWLSRNMFYLAYENYTPSRILLGVAMIFLNRTKRAVSLALRSRDIAKMVAVTKGTLRGFLEMRNAAIAGHERRPYKDPMLLSPVVDLLYILIPSKFVDSTVESIILQNIRRVSIKG